MTGNLSAMHAAPRWRVGLVTAAVHGLLLAGLFAAGGGGQAPTAALQAVAVRLLAQPSSAAPLATRLPQQTVAPPPAAPVQAQRPPLPIPPVELAIAAMEPPAAGAPAPPAAPAPVPMASPAVTVAAAAVTARPHPTPNRPASRSHCPAADYPALLRERGVEGLVRVRVQVGAQGEALAVQLAVGSGFRLLDEAALAQARACRYQAAIQDGAAVASWVEFPSRFSLQ